MFGRNLSILGAGLMGAGIAQVSLDKGYHVILKDATDAGLARGHNQISKAYEQSVKRKKFSRYKRTCCLVIICGFINISQLFFISLNSAEMERYMSNLSIQLDYKNFQTTDMVIEAVFESLDIKHK